MIQLLLYFALQFILFIPFYLIWRKDCKKIGKNNLAVGLSERFLYWLLLFPIWLFGIMQYLSI